MDIETEQHGYGEGDASFQAAGGFEGLQDLVERFYRVMGETPEGKRIFQMHPADQVTTKDKLARFLSSWLGGPPLFQMVYGPISIPSAHAHLDVGEDGRDAWLFCMQKALEEVDYEPAFKRYMLRALAIPAERIRIVAE